MNPEQENFDSLRRLLALKRHEQPPPGYFQDFSAQVLLRIRAGERVDRSSFWESLSWEAPWLQRLWASFETKPILAGALGMLVCGFLVSAIALSEKAANPAVANSEGGTAREDSTPALALQTATAPLGLSTTGLAPGQSAAVVFDGVQIPSAMLVSWPTGNEN
jgi:hypothetical protein